MGKWDTAQKPLFVSHLSHSQQNSSLFSVSHLSHLQTHNIQKKLAFVGIWRPRPTNLIFTIGNMLEYPHNAWSCGYHTHVHRQEN
jgi:hypothetical protein